jgi:hypothetical protein
MALAIDNETLPNSFKELSGSFNKTVVGFQFHLPFKMIMNTSLIFPGQQSNLISLLFYIYANF